MGSLDCKKHVPNYENKLHIANQGSYGKNVEIIFP